MLPVTRWIDVIANRVDVPARGLMSLLFLASGVGKLSAVSATQAYMQAFGVPRVLIWPAAAWEITAAVLLLIGLGIRPLALLLAGWCLLTAVIFHIAWADQIQQVMFLKNMTMAGGFLMLSKTGFWGRSVDAMLASSGQTSR
jgi:putative oxidoreductase